MRIEDQQLVIFFGDSLTEHPVAVSDSMETQVDELPPVGSQARVDRHEHRGWTAWLMALATIGYPQRSIRYENAGRGGDTSRHMLARLASDVLNHRPDWILLSAGVVDVRRTFQPARASEAVSLEEYAANLTAMIRQIQTAGAKVVLLEPTPHVRPPTGALPEVTVGEANALTRRYAAAMMKIARENEAIFIPLLETFERIETQIAGRPSSLHADEIHLNSVGDLLYAQLVYAALDMA